MTAHNAEYYDQIATIYHKLQGADAILVGGASGMSTANQHDFYGYSKYFRDNFSEFQRNYGIRNLCDALYYRYPSSEERWAYLAKHGTLMFDEPPGQTYIDLHTLIKDKIILLSRPIRICSFQSSFLMRSFVIRRAPLTGSSADSPVMMGSIHQNRWCAKSRPV